MRANSCCRARLKASAISFLALQDSSNPGRKRGSISLAQVLPESASVGGSPSSSNPNVGAFVTRAKERRRNLLNALNVVNGGIDSLCAGRFPSRVSRRMLRPRTRSLSPHPLAGRPQHTTRLTPSMAANARLRIRSPVGAEYSPPGCLAIFRRKWKNLLTSYALATVSEAARSSGPNYHPEAKTECAKLQ